MPNQNIQNISNKVNSSSWVNLIHISPKILSTIVKYTSKNKINLDTFLTPFISALKNNETTTFLSISPPESSPLSEKEIKLKNQVKSDIETYFQEHLSQVKLTLYSTDYQLITNLFGDKEITNIAYFNTIMPLIDTDITYKIWQQHTKYHADYSFGENIPVGITPTFFNNSILQTLDIYLKEKDILNEKNSIHLSKLILDNLNQFHVTIYYDKIDLRMLRLDFSLCSQRSIMKTYNLIEVLKNSKPTESLLNIQKILSEKPQYLFSFPSYIELEATSSCEYKCSFCPRQYYEVPNNELSLKAIDNIITSIKKNSLEDTSIALGGLGEPLQHSQIEQIIESLTQANILKFLVIETNGFYLDKITNLLKKIQPHNIKIIINLNSITHYKNIHGTKENFTEKIETNIQNYLIMLKSQYPDEYENLSKNIILQTLKIEENKSEWNSIYKVSKKLGISFLLQKYNTYNNLMPEKRISDMTPISRSFCWHLRRDLYIKANGNVAFCKQDIKNQHIRGNILETDLAIIWENQKKDWMENYQNKLSKKANCEICDEYFTFNL